MNIFPIDINPKNCAMWSCDQHVVKIISEAILVYNTIFSKVKPEIYTELPQEMKYKPLKNLPIVNWAMREENRIWLYYYIVEMNKEYKYRYGRENKAMLVFTNLARILKDDEKELPRIDKFELVMPEEFKKEDTVESYKDYYKWKFKKGFKKPMRWTKREIPEFLKRIL